MKFMNIPLAALICTAVLGSGNASADLTVTSGNATLKAFGLIDTGLVAVTHTGDGHQTKTDMTDGILSASGLGLGGSYDFGSGFKAIVNLQASFSPSRLQFQPTMNSSHAMPMPGLKVHGGLLRWVNSGILMTTGSLALCLRGL